MSNQLHLHPRSHGAASSTLVANSTVSRMGMYTRLSRGLVFPDMMASSAFSMEAFAMAIGLIQMLSLNYDNG